MIPEADTADFDEGRLLLVGASTRAAVFSALRAGFRPESVDLFADADLRSACPVHSVQDYPHGIAAALAPIPGGPAMYVGAIENCGRTIDALEQRGPLLGNPRHIVEAIRDPVRLSKTLAEFRLPTLAVRAADDPPPRDGGWLIKPLHSAGGRRISIWTGETAAPAEPYYFQEAAIGPSFSALFVAPPDRRDVRFVGLTRQIVGHPLLGAPPFAWAGSVGPETLPVAVEHLVRRIGNLLSWHCGLCGLFGFDFVLDADEVPRLTEVNPRYPGSAEVLEHTLALTLLRDHAAAFDHPLPDEWHLPPGVPAMGKFIVYADRDFIAPDPAEWLLPDEWLHGAAWRHVPRLADIPCAGTPVRAGRPFCTLFTVGKTSEDCLTQMPAAVEQLRARFL